MTRVSLIVLLLAGFGLPAFAQQAACPSFLIQSSGNTPPGERITFTANIDPLPEGLTYHWTTSGPWELEGQDSPVLYVRTPAKYCRTHVTATIEVAGLPAACPKIQSAEVKVEPEGVSQPFAVYGPETLRLEQLRFEKIANSLAEENIEVVFVIRHYRDSSKLQTSRARYTRILKHIKSIGFPSDKFEIIYTPSDRDEIRIYLIPFLPECDGK
jgi:hypothetical protein